MSKLQHSLSQFGNLKQKSAFETVRGKRPELDFPDYFIILVILIILFKHTIELNQFQTSYYNLKTTLLLMNYHICN